MDVQFRYFSEKLHHSSNKWLGKVRNGHRLSISSAQYHRYYSCHWYFAVICDPEYILVPTASNVTPPSTVTRQQTRQSIIDAPDETMYIFTFDSLGNHHNKTIRNLSAYLEMEALDKKEVAASARNVRYKLALVACVWVPNIFFGYFFFQKAFFRYHPNAIPTAAAYTCSTLLRFSWKILTIIGAWF